MAGPALPTVWVLGDQLNRGIASLDGVRPGTARILMVESRATIGRMPRHRQRLHLVLASMRRFARDLEAEGYAVDYRSADGFADGLEAHRRAHRPPAVRVMEPMSWRMRGTLRRLDVEVVRSNQFTCHADEFAGWAAGRRRLVMEDFYRWQRRRLGVLMDGDRPAGGRWNFDAENRKPPPRTGTPWAPPEPFPLDDVDRAALAVLPADAFGAPPDGLWATSRAGALARLRHFVAHNLPGFGTHQDAMTRRSWHLAHALLSPYLNLGMLHPREVVEAAEQAHRTGAAPLAAVEGFVRQVIGWREYVWGTFWLWMPGWRDANALDARRPLPPAFTDPQRTRMRCLGETLRAVHERGYAHHIQRLMILGNLALLAGVVPQAVAGWMEASFVDGAEWVMVPNAIGMACHADGGRMMTKPYAAGGAYVRRMSDYCGACPYDPRRRTGDDACPYTTLYWAFLDRHRATFARNLRMRGPLAALDRLGDLPGVRARAAEIGARLDRGEA